MAPPPGLIAEETRATSMERGGRAGVDVFVPLLLLVLSDALLILERGAKIPGQEGEERAAVGKRQGLFW